MDPFHGTPDCDRANPATCQVGDLSGKHGKIVPSNETTEERWNKTVIAFRANYVDRNVTLDMNSPAFVGNRSIVLHIDDDRKTTLACADFIAAPT